MSDSYTKLFSSITASTIVSEPLATRWLWVTMLAMADVNGDVHGSVPGLARIANIPLSDCESALKCFLNPDAYSRTKDHDGRRVEEIDGGWKLLNHAKYRKIRSAEERREYMREYMRKRRAELAAYDESCKHHSKQLLAESTEVTPPSPSPSPKKEQKKKHASADVDLLAGINPQIAKDFKALRSRQHAPITETAMKGIAREATKAGMSVEDALRTCCENSWRGFKADWLKGKPNGKATGYQQLPGEL